MTRHALLSPSSSNRWIPCPGSKAGNLIKTKSNEAADAGTRQHDMAACFLETDSGLTEDEKEELWDSTKRFICFVNELRGEAGVECFIEHTFKSSLFPEEFFGTIDALVIDGDTMYVVDLKTGRVEVLAKGNTQLMSYLCLARDYYPECTKFYGVIVQNEIDMVEFSAEELDRHMENVCNSVQSDERHAGPHCQYCPLIMHCDENRQYVYDTADVMFDDETEVDLEDCKRLLDLKPVVDELAKLALEELTSAMLDGREVEGWKLGQKLGNRAWKDEEEAHEVLSPYLMNPDDLYEKSFVSPAKAEKLLKGVGGEKELVNPLVSREVKPPVAVPERSRVQTYVPPAGEIFEDVS